MLTLTPRDAEVVQSYATLGSATEVARSLGMHRNGVYQHLQRSRDRNGCADYRDLVRRFNDEGWEPWP